MKNIKTKAEAILIFFTMPNFALAQQNETFAPLTGTIGSIGEIVRQLVPILSLVVVLAFFWGLAKFVFSAGDAEKAKEGKSLMIRGIIGMFVLVSIWGIIGLLQESLGTNVAPQQIDLKLPDLTPGRVVE